MKRQRWRRDPQGRAVLLPPAVVPAAGTVPREAMETDGEAHAGYRGAGRFGSHQQRAVVGVAGARGAEEDVELRVLLWNTLAQCCSNPSCAEGGGAPQPGVLAAVLPVDARALTSAGQLHAVSTAPRPALAAESRGIDCASVPQGSSAHDGSRSQAGGGARPRSRTPKQDTPVRLQDTLDLSRAI